MCQCVVVCWHGRSYTSGFPHHLWPPVEPWRGYCLQRSGPGKYSNQHLPAAQMRWSGLHWATPKSDCWAAGVGWERANSAGNGTNSQLVRTWKQFNLEELQKCSHIHHHRIHTYTVHTNVQTHPTISVITAWTILSLTMWTDFTSCKTCLMTWFHTYSWAKPVAPLS